MKLRSRFAALVGAGLLTFGVASVALADPPEYAIEVTKTADPAAVPPEGWDVTFTVWVHNTGTGHFNDVDVSDDMVDCTLAGPFGDQDNGAGAGKLEADETWTYTCTVADVVPDTTNTASVGACHNGGDCGNPENHAVSAEASVTVPEGEAPVVTPVASEPGTDTAFASGTSRPADPAWLLLAALGALLGSMVVLSPARVKNRR